MKIKNVYIVTAGEYSDYSIQAVFFDKDQADAYCTIHNKKEEYYKYRVEEHIVNTACYTAGNTVIKVWRAYDYFINHPLTGHTKQTDCSMLEVLETEFDTFSQYKSHPTPAEVLKAKEDGRDFNELFFEVFSDKSDNHAFKKLQDYKAKMKALWESV